MDQRSLTLNPEFCLERQKRLGNILSQRDVDFALLVRPEHVQYFTGFRPPHVFQAAVALFPNGQTVLAVPRQISDQGVASEIVTFDAQWQCTLRQDQLSAALDVVWPHVLSRTDGQRMGIEASVNPALKVPWLETHPHVFDLEPDLWMLRRRKDVDELAMIQRAFDCTEAMYQRAREIISPGITELEVFNQLHAVAVNVAGEPLLAIGNDFQCNSPGGPPRPRPVQKGELYILDLGVSYRGYYSDSCRTLSVDHSPTDQQLRAWSAIVQVLDFVEGTVRPGVSACELYRQAREILDEVIPGTFFHHLGHGIGLFPHEAPHLNDYWDDDFQEGDVFTAEPGLYAPELHTGIRLEQAYVVTAEGIRRLTAAPLRL
ncbi:MAG TPA: Xaa-Pro peptidase family protein [Planctomicrobium sp.]|nr:Xaa-Pro peptidase family protein [Planctomicrobium sp.]